MKKAIITKVTDFLFESVEGGKKAIGISVEYRLFGILLCKKVSYSPEKYGITDFRTIINP